MKDKYPRLNHDNTSENQFYSNLLDSLGNLNKLLSNNQCPQLHQDITTFLSAVDNNSGQIDLLPAIRFKLYALLALTR